MTDCERDEFQFHIGECTNDDYVNTILQGLQLAFEIIFLILYVIHMIRNRFQILLHNDKTKKTIPHFQNYSRAVLFVCLGIRSVIVITTWIVRIALDETMADRQYLTTFLSGMVLIMWWCCTLTYRMSLLALYMLLDRQLKASLKKLSVLLFVAWIVFIIQMFIGGGLNCAGYITPLVWQQWYWGSLVTSILLASPFWGILPGLMIREMKARILTGTSHTDETAKIVRKIEVGLIIQVVSGIVSSLLCLFVLTIPQLNKHNEIIWQFTSMIGCVHVYMQFFVFGGLSRGRYSSYLKSNDQVLQTQGSGTGTTRKDMKDLTVSQSVRETESENAKTTNAGGYTSERTENNFQNSSEIAVTTQSEEKQLEITNNNTDGERERKNSNEEKESQQSEENA